MGRTRLQVIVPRSGSQEEGAGCEAHPLSTEDIMKAQSRGIQGEKSMLGLRGIESVLKASNKCLELPTNTTGRGKGPMGGEKEGREVDGEGVGKGEGEKEPSWPSGETES